MDTNRLYFVESNSLATTCEQEFFTIARVNITYDCTNTPSDLRRVLHHYVYGYSPRCIRLNDVVELTIDRLVRFHTLFTVF
jgi:hypothetical protein